MTNEVTKPRIGLVVPALEWGGGVPTVAAFALSVLRSSAFDYTVVSLTQSSREDCNVRLSAPSTMLRGIQVRKGEWNGAPFAHVGALFSELEFQRYRPREALARLLEPCDVIQVVSGFPAWANAVAGLGKPVSIHCATLARLERRMRDSSGRGLIGQWRRLMTRVTDRLDVRGLRSVRAVQAMNPSLEAFARKVAGERDVDIRLAPPGINIDRYRPGSGSRDRYILFVGRLDDPRKNIGLLLNMMSGLSGLRLVLAGQTAPGRDFWERAASLGLTSAIDVRLNATSSELITLYQSALAFVLPSDEEGFGMVVLEAMACGTPAVATRCGGPEGIINDGIDGFLIPRGDANAMRERVHALASSEELRSSMAAAARAAVESRFSEAAAVTQFRELWTRLAQPRASCPCAA